MPAGGSMARGVLWLCVWRADVEIVGAGAFPVAGGAGRTADLFHRNRRSGGLAGHGNVRGNFHSKEEKGGYSMHGSVRYMCDIRADGGEDPGD